MPLSAGDKLGPYEISSRIGAGGMGEVYRAVDSRLGREVAIKISNGEFIGRFRREAAAISALNHPHICTLYDVGPDYLVMELVEGENLAVRLKRGHLSTEATLRYGGQIAAALAEAHIKGITHRDLKPSNVMLTKNGVKVLDFGLAKSASDDTVTLTEHVMGTPAYMAPEQRNGKECDARTDIYALGLVLYEMSTGKRTIPGTPPQLELLPERLAHVVERCVASDPDSRWQNARDVLFELEWAAISRSSGVPSRAHSRFWPSVAGLLIVVLSVLVFIHFRNSGPEQPVVRSAILPPEKTSFTFAKNLGLMALSPDGKRMVFAATGQDEKSQLWIRALDSPAARPLQGTQGAIFPFWSPDSLWVAFFADGKLKKIDTRGGSPVALAEASSGYGGSWSAKGMIVFAPTIFAPLLKVSQDGGKPSAAIQVDIEGHGFPWFLPDGDHFLFASWGGSGRMTVRLASLGSVESRTIGEADSNAMYSDGHLLYLRGNSLIAQPFDLRSLRTTGEAELIAEGVLHFLDLVAVGAFSTSNSGLLAYQTGSGGGLRQLTWFDRRGRPMGMVGDPRSFYSIEFSPDQRYLAASASDSLGNFDLWMYDVSRGLPVRFTSDPAGEYYAIWSPDGRSVVFNSTRKGHYDLYRKQANGEGADQLLYADDTDKVPTGWSPDGRFILYFTGGGPRHDLWLLPFIPDHPGEASKPIPLLKTGFNELFAQFSPDGEWLSYAADDSGQSEIYVAPLLRPAEKHQISPNGGQRPRWRRDGKEIFYTGLDDKLMAAKIHVSGGQVEVGEVQSLIVGSPRTSSSGYTYDLSGDGQRILAAVPAEESAAEPVTLLQNWTAALKKRK